MSNTMLAKPARVRSAREMLEQGIVRAIAYADVFDYPLTLDEIHRYLVGVTAGPAAVCDALSDGQLVPRSLSRHGRYYTLPGRELVVQTRRERAAVSARYWPLARRYATLIGQLPFVRMVAVTGSLSMDNVADGDIDYLIVTEPGRLWLCRALVIGIVRAAALRGVRLCPNYFLAECALVLGERNLFTAHEVTQMVPVVGMPTYAQLRRTNAWTRTFLPNALGSPRDTQPVQPRARRARRLVEATLRTRAVGRLEAWEMRRKIRKLGDQANGHVEAAFGPHWCKGHFDDHGRRTLARYTERLGGLDIAGSHG